jgi:hypothetical protein
MADGLLSLARGRYLPRMFLECALAVRKAPDRFRLRTLPLCRCFATHRPQGSAVDLCTTIAERIEE